MATIVTTFGDREQRRVDGVVAELGIMTRTSRQSNRMQPATVPLSVQPPKITAAMAM
jgi:hypothetical protein